MTDECTCLPYSAGGYGPEGDCPVHGVTDLTDIELARTSGRREVICDMREFADDLYGITGARWIADALTARLDHISEGPPTARCDCGHLAEDHDPDDGCGACAMAMRGPCLQFRKATS